MKSGSGKGVGHFLKGAIGTAAVVGMAVGAGVTPAHAAGGQVYVALGDSMASGPLIPDFTGPLACGRSTHNYAHTLAKSLGVSVLRDVTCSGAKSSHMTEPQKLSIAGVSMGQAAPQFDALTSDTTLVTLTVGGNDIGLVGIAQGCLQLDPTAAPCKNAYVQNGVDQIGQRVDTYATRFATVLDGIHQRSPQARVVVTGYGDYVKSGGCWPLVPVLSPDADWLQGSVDHLNQVIADTASAHGATYVDVRTPSAGHDACADDKWIEGYVPTALAAPLHPNQKGEENYARIIGQVLSAGA